MSIRRSFFYLPSAPREKKCILDCMHFQHLFAFILIIEKILSSHRKSSIILSLSYLVVYPTYQLPTQALHTL